MGNTPHSVLMLDKKDEMGLCVMDFMFLNDDYPSVLENLNDSELSKKDDDVLEDLGGNLFNSL